MTAGLAMSNLNNLGKMGNHHMSYYCSNLFKPGYFFFDPSDKPSPLSEREYFPVQRSGFNKPGLTGPCQFKMEICV